MLIGVDIENILNISTYRILFKSCESRVVCVREVRSPNLSSIPIPLPREQSPRTDMSGKDRLPFEPVLLDSDRKKLDDFKKQIDRTDLVLGS
jgi:hypothetical protein